MNSEKLLYPRLPSALAEVAMVDAATCAAVGGMKEGWWAAEVRAGRAPAPVIREPRCTRWLVSEVRTFYLRRTETAGPDSPAATAMVKRAAAASSAAQGKQKVA